ncbi:hypothetical protein HYH96_17285 [Clostridium botulinum]|uniref:hypothetical protein n=1 Tax=Clostridium botulinum TaxID=1491 RepID=UPI00174AFF32|nr:hypothetical protein [Clostridium botulinum]MBD5631168.1 hypothetical protein [Clostridium botulinum]MBD5645626.1 hypothetical protein [Clostridium botulinum]
MERKWIPVIEKLPTSSGKFEVTIKSKKKRYVEICNYNYQSKVYPWGSKWEQVNVIAWRERDKPYQGD